LPKIVTIEPSRRLAKVPAIGVAAVLLMTVTRGSHGKSAKDYSDNVYGGATGDGGAIRDDSVGPGVVACGLEGIEIAAAGLKCKAAFNAAIGFGPGTNWARPVGAARRARVTREKVRILMVRHF
jgi:hypothetical protein